MRIVKYPHPTLKHKSKPLRRVDAELKQIVREMFELMYESNGVGLAANQVDLPYRLFVLNLTGEEGQGEEHVFINPEITKRSGMIEAEEGCLSFPDIWAPVKRSEKIEIAYYDLSGKEQRRQLDGFFARACQHEYDHLEGISFVDRLSPAVYLSIRDKLDELVREYEGDRGRGFIPDDGEIATRLAELEALRT